MLYTYWKHGFLSYIVEQAFQSIQDISWKKVSKLFPSQTVKSLNIALSATHFGDSKKPLYMHLQENLYKYKVKSYTNKEKNYRDKIVNIYTKCTVN
jgi:hypothetical protein